MQSALKRSESQILETEFLEALKKNLMATNTGSYAY